MRTLAGKKNYTTPVNCSSHNSVFYLPLFWYLLCQNKCLIGSVLALKCSLWYVISTFVTNFVAFVRGSAYHVSKVHKSCPEMLQHEEN